MTCAASTELTLGAAPIKDYPHVKKIRRATKYGFIINDNGVITNPRPMTIFEKGLKKIVINLARFDDDRYGSALDINLVTSGAASPIDVKHSKRYPTSEEAILAQLNSAMSFATRNNAEAEILAIIQKKRDFYEQPRLF